MRYVSHATKIRDAEPDNPGYLLTYLRIMRPHSLTFSSSASVPPEVRKVVGWARRVAGAMRGVAGGAGWRRSGGLTAVHVHARMERLLDHRLRCAALSAHGLDLVRVRVGVGVMVKS